MQVTKTFRTLCASIAVTTVLALAGTALAANYPLELTNIKPVGVDGMDSNNRIFRAYPGIEYNIRAAVVGGDYPFTYSLSNAPSGMTINASTGTISWPNPTGSPVTPTITVTDSASPPAQVQASWTITVTTTGFRFLDAVNGTRASGNGCSSSCGTGTFANPWRVISDFYEGSSGPSTYANDFLYFRTGTYDVLDLPRTSVGGLWERVEFGTTKPNVWMAYPGETPLIDFGYELGVENAPFIRLGSTNVFVDGFETINTRIMAFQVTDAHYVVMRRLKMHDHGPGIDGSNSAFIMTTTNPPFRYMVIQDSEFYHSISEPGADCAIKIYAREKLLIEDNVFYDLRTAIELKDDARQFSVRGNTFHTISRVAIGGNMHETTTYGEILFNNVRAPGAAAALDVNQDGMASSIHIYRNTFQGRVRVRNTDTADGPFYFSNNVIVNDDAGTPSGSHIYHENVSSPSRIVLSNNLVGYPADNILEPNLTLTSAYSAYVGTRGFQLGGPRPPAPRNLRVQ
jgi:hypothetical protein